MSYVRFQPIYGSNLEYIEREMELHRSILMMLQIQQQRTFHIFHNGSDEAFLPNIEQIICPKCGANDWHIFETEIETKEKFKFQMTAFWCKNKTCRFLYPSHAKIPDDLR